MRGQCEASAHSREPLPADLACTVREPAEWRETEVFPAMARNTAAKLRVVLCVNVTRVGTVTAMAHSACDTHKAVLHPATLRPSSSRTNCFINHFQ